MANPTAAICVIGDEILSGRTKDKNIGWIAEQLCGLGIQLTEARVIADEKKTIIRHIRELSDANDYVFTSGGIGPTHDDITTESVAAAFDVDVERNQEAMRRLEQHYKGTEIVLNEVRKKMADIPASATLIDNPVSAAPGFQLKNVYVMAGVPSIMQSMFEGIAVTLQGGTIPTRLTVQCATGEGNVAQILEQISDHYESVSVGSYPWFKPGLFGTAVVLTSLDEDLAAKAARELCELVRQAGFAAEDAV
ncbi:MAG: competence/damage-inducible protein A [Alphaproteobacteria bacterium]|jgi:molybdenum cofactor synthesis domain-containing protein|nr:competence/damage-inducible protein A [Alphaproteobacteria bacterium]